MNQESRIETDLLIIGAGVAGCVSAIALAEGYRVTLIDKRAMPEDRIGESLAPAAQRILQQLNLDEDEDPDSGNHLWIPNLGMQSYWGSERVQIVDHLRNPDGLGRNLDRKAFEQYLRKQAQGRGVRCLWPLKFHSSSFKQGRWHITTTSTDIKNRKTVLISAGLVIDASGRQAHFARSLGIRRQAYDKLMACWVSMTNYEENKMSTLSAGEMGWWYSAVVPNNKRVMAFHTDVDLLDRGHFKTLDAFLLLTRENREMKTIIHKTNGDMTHHGTVSANSTRLEHVAGRQWLALGDAAISFDPLSAQGMFHAMASALQVRDLITGCDIITDPTPHNLEQFEHMYTHQIHQIWNHYLTHKNMFYRAEMRWRESVFWKRRHGSMNPDVLITDEL